MICGTAASLLVQELESEWLTSYSILCAIRDNMLHRLIDSMIPYKEIQLEAEIGHAMSRLDPAVEPFKLEDCDTLE